VYLSGLDRIVAPRIESFAPTWLIVSAGFDAHRRDPLTDLGLTSGDYALITRRLLDMAPTARRLMVLEGGYDLQALEDSSAAAMAALVGVDHQPERPSAGGPGHRVLDAVVEQWADLLPA
jgi:acetoin utilization deacetylase AcuC-like enzyme